MRVYRKRAGVYHVLPSLGESGDTLEQAKVCLEESMHTKDEVTTMEVMEVPGRNSTTTETALVVTIRSGSRMGLTARGIASVLEAEGRFSCPQLDG